MIELSDELFAHNACFDSSLFRNIPGKLPEMEVFDDLTSDKKLHQQANDLASLNRVIEWNHSATTTYERAINYGFKLRRWRPSRYSDGCFYVWYGACDLTTSIQETIYHWQHDFLEDCGFHQLDEPIYSFRNIYTVDCKAILIDLSQKTSKFPRLTQPDRHDYSYTQAIGQQINFEGHPGLMTRSSRHPEGKNCAIFRKNVLSNPKLVKHLEYCYTPRSGKLKVTEGNKRVVVH